MTQRELNLNESVYLLCTRYPELKDIMAEMGFSDITKPGMLGSVGRLMTLPKGAAMRGIDIGTIKAHLETRGFVVKDEGEAAIEK
jgi:hypothetical protein